LVRIALFASETEIGQLSILVFIGGQGAIFVRVGDIEDVFNDCLPIQRISSKAGEGKSANGENRKKRGDEHDRLQKNAGVRVRANVFSPGSFPSA
jgi:hypothetical protein